MVQQNSSEGTMIKTLLKRKERIGRFTFVLLEDIKTQIQSVGVSKRGEGDYPSDQRGVDVATGRAQKAMAIKLYNMTNPKKRKKLQHHYMA